MIRNRFIISITQTNPAKENLTMKINADNTTFSAIASFLKNGSSITEYELLVIDECSTVSNKDMVAVLEKANFKMLLVGDTYQIAPADIMNVSFISSSIKDHAFSFATKLEFSTILVFLNSAIALYKVCIQAYSYALP